MSLFADYNVIAVRDDSGSHFAVFNTWYQAVTTVAVVFAHIKINTWQMF